ncbi:hypothetical protein [Aliiglaciecola sp. M165]|uniref:hypothetical protein n=1 Tax=Aliiglaciecola sp. M165 TaxID=2593649 RepID=UPI00117EB5BA|nr:hypothetical protein [Aliiglaciecola sp. M165]TRY30328.1 hypothetical protein FM019_16080 [Aliiglaciecola sp. M165]
MDILNNAWVVGIGGGILSGLLVTLITRYIFSKKDNKEYIQKLATVNREVVYALRPGISEGHIPDEEVLSSLINATARKYKVTRDDVFRPKQIAEELIKEIMDSSFISSETKKNYCETLAHLISKKEEVEDVLSNSSAENLERKISESDYRSRLVARMSSILGLTAAMGTMTVVLLRDLGAINDGGFSKLFDIAAPGFTVVFATMVAMMAMVLTMKLKTLRNESQDNDSEKSKK